LCDTITRLDGRNVSSFSGGQTPNFYQVPNRPPSSHASTSNINCFGEPRVVRYKVSDG